MPKVSVIVPVYNTEKYLDRCLESLINQTFKDIEIIIVNDGSTDNSEEIIKKYVKQYPDIMKYIFQKNQGLSSARNNGVKLATGKYISFVDSDDYIDVDLYKNLENIMNGDIDLIKFKMVKTDENLKNLQKIEGPVFGPIDGQEAFNLLVFKDILLEPACIYLYKRETYLKNKFQFSEKKYHEDFGLIPIILIKSKKVVSVDIYGYYYVQSNSSITRNDNYEKQKKSAYDLLYHYDNLQKQIKNIKPKTRENILQYYTNSILLATKKLNKKDINKYIKEIKKRKLTDNIKPKNMKTFIKKIIIKINIKLYLKLA